MKKYFALAGFILALPIGAQVTAPSSPVAAPTAPVSVPNAAVAVPRATVTAPRTPITPVNPALQPDAIVDPAVPPDLSPQAVGRTFPSVPGWPEAVGIPKSGPYVPFPTLGPPPVAVPRAAGNSAINGAFGTAGVPGTGVVNPTLAAPLTNIAPPIVIAPVPTRVDLPPGTVIRTTRTPNTVGTPTRPNAVGAAASGQQGARAPAAVPPQR